ncbi:MAG: TlpA disulfide reductase family protein [Chitinophagales bacterium]
MIILVHKKYYLTALLSLLFLFMNAQINAPVFDFAQYEKRVLQQNDTLYVVNFWATWCKPCVEELPFFEKAKQTFSKNTVKFILVSQDAKTRSAYVTDFLKKNNYTSESFILSAGNPNIWIDKIDTAWSGLIPMTVFYKAGKKVYFHESDYTSYEELEKIIHSKL